MLHNEFPRLYVATVQSREVLRMLRYRQKLIKMRTMVKNSLQALALQSGLARGSRLFSKAGLQELRCAPMSPAMQWQREQWLQLLEGLNQRVREVMQWLQHQSVRRVPKRMVLGLWSWVFDNWEIKAATQRPKTLDRNHLKLRINFLLQHSLNRHQCPSQ
jgi:hypothetical protein